MSAAGVAPLQKKEVEAILAHPHPGSLQDFFNCKYVYFIFKNFYIPTTKIAHIVIIGEQ